jgi:hypothetical protein
MGKEYRVGCGYARPDPVVPFHGKPFRALMLNEVVPDDDKAELCKCHKNSNEK